ncbi:hypothetical protein A9Q84_05520 [Halobacteriovorax marinus]|uniref:ABC transmembrane type-2 domain-containing protein n=1 Tax=Halobacteriovorax marinus TaxID=97084 RepID=A0A1Y5FGQ2_9BACT|nr:hypothetical protein A9Q84_05520 [Halobacteriovorax marinus]
MKNIKHLIVQEIKVLLCDKRALGILFAMPMILILFLSLALTDVYHQKVGKKIHITMLTDHSKTTEEIVQQFKNFNYHIEHITEHQGIEASLKKEKSDVIIEIPKSIKNILVGTKSADSIKMYFRPTLDKSYQELVKGHFTIALQSMVIDQVNRRLKKMNESKELKKSVVINQLSQNKNFIEVMTTNNVIPNPIQQTVPAWALFAMFFIVIPLSNSFIRDRNSGILKRLLCYNISKAELLIGKLIPYILINIIQFSLMLLVGQFIVPLFTSKDFSLGEINSLLILVTLVCSIASTSFALLVSTVSNSSAQAHSFGPLAIVIMALFGGVMIPHFVMPEFMQYLSYLSPLYWALESYLDIFLRGATLTIVAPKLYVLLGFSLVAFGVSLKKFRWSE